VLARLTLERRTQGTLTELNLLEAELDRLAVRGIGIDNEELVRGMVAVAVPVRDTTDGHVLASLAIHAPTARASLNDLLKAVPRLKDAALKLAPLLSAGPSAEHAHHER
jgi:DNA-binding IclR family transcriptional regulator